MTSPAAGARVVHIVPLMSPRAEYGGPASVALRLAGRWNARGGQAEVLSLWPRDGGARPERLQGVPLRLFPVSFRVPGHRFVGLWSWPAAWWVLRRAGGVDLVHLHSGRELWVVFCALVLRWRGIPYVWQCHGMLAPSAQPVAQVLDRTVVPLVLRRARAVLHLTSRERDELRDLHGLDNLSELINGITVPAGVAAPTLQPADEPLRLVAICRLHRRKRVPELVRAVVAERHAGRDLRLVIFGPDEGDLPAVQVELAADPSGQVSYGGPLTYEQVPVELARHHVLALTSVDEPFPMSVLEGMAHGLAPIVSRSCGLAPYIDGAAAGLVVGDDDQEGIRAALRALDDDRDGLQARRMAALRLARTTFALEVVVDRLTEIYAAAGAKSPEANRVDPSGAVTTRTPETVSGPDPR